MQSQGLEPWPPAKARRFSSHRLLLLSTSTVVLALACGGVRPALAQLSATWAGPGSDWNTGANWSTGTIPTQVATFTGANPTAVTIFKPSPIGHADTFIETIRLEFPDRRPTHLRSRPQGEAANSSQILLTCFVWALSTTPPACRHSMCRQAVA